MKLTHEITVLLLGCVAITDAAGRAAAGAAANLAVLDVPAAASSDDGETFGLVGIDDGAEYQDDEDVLTSPSQDDSSDAEPDKVQFTHKTVDSHVHFVDGPATLAPLASINALDYTNVPLPRPDGQVMQEAEATPASVPLPRQMDIQDGLAATADEEIAASVPMPSPIGIVDGLPGQNAHQQYADDTSMLTDPTISDVNIGADSVYASEGADNVDGAYEAPDAVPSEQLPPDASGENEEGDSDSYAMMMYYKGRSASVEKENKRMKEMLAQAAAWGKGMKNTVSNLDSQRKETVALKAQLRGFKAGREKIGRELQAERAREKAAENRVKALEYVHQELSGVQGDNTALERKLLNTTRADEDLHVQLVASQQGVAAEDRSRSAVAERLTQEQKLLDEELRKLERVKVAKQKEDLQLKESKQNEEASSKLKKVVDQRDKLLRQGLQQLLEEKEREQELQRQLDSQKAAFAGQLRGQQANVTGLEHQLKSSNAKVKELKRAVATTWRNVAQGDKARKQVQHNLSQTKAALKEIQEADQQAQAKKHSLQQKVDAEKVALHDASQKEQLADEARDAAQAEVASAQTTIDKLNQQHEAVAEENRDLMDALARTKREESQLLRDAMGSVSDAGGLDLENLSTSPANNRTSASAPAIEESSTADLPTLDVLPP